MRAFVVAAAVAVVVFTVVACLENYEGVLCDESNACPGGYFCFEGKCSLGSAPELEDAGEQDAGTTDGGCSVPDSTNVERLPLTPHLGFTPQGPVRFSWRTFGSASCDVTYRVRVSSVCTMQTDAGCSALGAPLDFDQQTDAGTTLATWSSPTNVNTRYFWQLEVCGDVCAMSGVRYFDYDRGPNDFRGQRAPDVAVASSWFADGGGELVVFEGGALGSPVDVWPKPAKDELLPVLAGVGDMDGDGKDDLGITLPLHRSDGGTVDQPSLWRVFGGSSPTLAALRVPNASRVVSVAGVGDVNRDGLSDAVVSDSDQSSWLVYGTRSRTAARIEALSTPGISVDFQLGFAAGDMNADGYDDVVLGGRGNSGGVYVVLFLGGPSRMTFANYKPFQATAKQFGRVAASASDVNNDGFDDLVAISDTDNRLFFGGELGFSSNEQPWSTSVQSGVQFAGDALGEPSYLLTGPLLDAGTPSTVCRAGLTSCASGVPSTGWITPVGRVGSAPRSALAAYQPGVNGVQIITCDGNTTSCAVEGTLTRGTDPSFGIGVATMPGVAR